jgi:hypothetical protein
MDIVEVEADYNYRISGVRVGAKLGGNNYFVQDVGRSKY